MGESDSVSMGQINRTLAWYLFCNLIHGLKMRGQCLVYRSSDLERFASPRLTQV